MELRTKKVGKSCGILEMSIIYDKRDPMPIPRSEVVVNCDTAFPEISPMLLFLAKRILMEALLAEASRKQMFFMTLAVEARKRKR